MKQRLFWPLCVLVALAVLELVLGRALAAREPLQAILTGKLWVAGLALGALSARLALYFVAPAWFAAACVESWLARRESKAD